MNSPFYTHQEYLIEELVRLDLDKKTKILEFGCGHGSSQILHEYAKNNPNCNIKSYESDNGWLDSVAGEYALENYIFEHVPNWDNFLIPNNFLEKYDLVFIDQSPWEARIKTINALKNNASIIILHDYDFYNQNVTRNIYSVGGDSFFKIYLDDFILIPHYEILPPTLIFKSKEGNEN